LTLWQNPLTMLFSSTLLNVFRILYSSSKSFGVIYNHTLEIFIDTDVFTRILYWRNSFSSKYHNITSFIFRCNNLYCLLYAIILKSPGVCKASICREVFNKETFHKTILRPPVVKQVYKIIWNPYEFHRFYLTSPTI